MLTSLIASIRDAGLIQFGAFRVHGKTQPVALHLEMLPSYPSALHEAGLQIEQLITAHPEAIDRLLCTVDAIGLAAPAAIRLNKPLVIYDDRHREPVLVGAYDIGHPTALVVNHTSEPKSIEAMIQTARRVGLEIKLLAALMNVSDMSDLVGIAYLSVFDLLDVVEIAELGETIPAGQAALVRKWSGR